MPYFIAGLAVLLIYRRLRRSFGRQPVRRGRMGLRLGLLVLLGSSMLPAALRSGQFLASELIGVTAGVLLGWWGIRHTRFLRHDGRLYYVPHTYSGIAVSLLFVGRLVYRLVVVYTGSRGAAPDDRFDLDSMSMMQSPLTSGLVLVLVGYYLTYYAGILRKSTRISPEDLEADTTPIGAAAHSARASG